MRLEDLKLILNINYHNYITPPLSLWHYANLQLLKTHPRGFFPGSTFELLQVNLSASAFHLK